MLRMIPFVPFWFATRNRPLPNPSSLGHTAPWQRPVPAGETFELPAKR